MYSIKELLKGVNYEIIKGEECDVTDVIYDNSKVSPGSLFVCVKGVHFDGHDAISDVIKKGAKAILVERDVEVEEDVTIIKVESTRYAMAFVAASYYGHPASSLKVI